MVDLQDRTHIDTELLNPDVGDLHKLDIDSCIDVMHTQDKVVIEAMESARESIVSFISELMTKYSQGGRLIYLGAGTSGRLGVLDASEIPPTFQEDPNRVIGMIAGGDSALRISSEGKEDDEDEFKEQLEALKLTSKDTILGIASGGTTTCVHGALEHAKIMDDGILTALLTCSKIEKKGYIDHMLFLPTGPEMIAGSTRMKAGTATKMALNMISTTLMIQMGKVYKNMMVDVKASNSKLVDRAIRIIMEITEVPREEAQKLLEKAEGTVKVAIVMNKLDVDRIEAIKQLTLVNGHLEKVID